MVRPTQDSIDTFTRITGASESIALQKLEEFGGNLAEAVNAHFIEVERQIANRVDVPPQFNYVDRSQQMQAGAPGLLPFLSAARTFKPSLLLDPNYRRNILNQLGGSVFNSSRPQFMHPGEYNPGYAQPYHSGARPAVEDVSGASLAHEQQYHGNISNDHGSHPYGDDAEEEMIRYAIEASRQEGSSSVERPQNELHLEDEEFNRALSLSLKTAEEEEAMREIMLEHQQQLLEVHESSRRHDKPGNGRQKSKPGSSSSQEGVQQVQEHPFLRGISSKDLDEAILLEKALFGDISESKSLQHASHVQSAHDRSTPHPPPSSSLVAEQLLRGQQDDEYLASLLADIEKEMNNSKKSETLSSKEAESKNNMVDAEVLEKLIEAKEASLPQEPRVDDENAVTLLVRMPDGSRIGRRFLKSDRLQCLFDFIDVSKTVKPGTYRVVRPFPKHAFSVTDCPLSLNELGLTNKQEALFLELI